MRLSYLNVYSLRNHITSRRLLAFKEDVAEQAAKECLFVAREFYQEIKLTPSAKIHGLRAPYSPREQHRNQRKLVPIHPRTIVLKSPQAPSLVRSSAQ